MIIDFECDSPTEEVKKETIALLKSGGGFVHRGYFAQFGRHWAEMLDLTGIDLAYIMATERFKKSWDLGDLPVPSVVEKYVKGNFGQKTGKGWYDYTKK